MCSRYDMVMTPFNETEGWARGQERAGTAQPSGSQISTFTALTCDSSH